MLYEVITVATLNFNAYKASAEAAIATLNTQNVDVIVCLAHVSRNETELLANQVSGIDVIIDGHDHVSTSTTVVITSYSIHYTKLYDYIFYKGLFSLIFFNQ